MESDLLPDDEADDQIEPPPPSYAVAKDLDALSSIANLFGLVFVLKGNKIQIQDTDNIIYSISLSPGEGKGTNLTFSLLTYQINKTDPTGPKVETYKKLYAVQSWKSSNNEAIIPASYSVSSETRSFYAYKHGCNIHQGDYNMLPFGMLLRSVGVHTNLRSWRLQCDDSKVDNHSEAMGVIRKLKHRNCGEYEWVSSSGEVLAIESISGSDERLPTFEIKTDAKNRKLIHAMALCWAVIIWHDAKLQRNKEHAEELTKSLTCELMQILDSSLD
jgi:hypothetical protein